MSYLSEMRLVVIPVTTNLLIRPSRALDVVYKFAQERHIPVLTLMQEDGLVELYTRVFGDLQFLDKHAKDDTAIPFEKKLADYLSSVLVGDELAEKAREAFDAYIFLSYRKKDRVYAQELMRLIHKNDFCRDIAIWYDEFLTPGEGFNGAIKAALEKSSLFALAVTPNLLEDGNYVMREEYPAAKKSGKTILPAEVVMTDRDELKAKYEGIPECTDAHDAPRLTESLLTALEGIAKRDNDKDPAHNFMIGLDYLTGIDVEVDVDRALALITGAAEAGVVGAIKKLVAMYRSGDGVEVDHFRAIEWQCKLVNLWEVRYNKSGSDYDGMQCMIEFDTLGDYWRELGRLSEAKGCYEKALEISKMVADSTSGSYVRMAVGLSYEKLGETAEEEGRLTDARRYYERALEINAAVAEETKTPTFRRYLSINYSRLGDIAWEERRLDDAWEYYRKSFAISMALAKEINDAESRRDLSVSYNRLGRMAEAEGRLGDARGYYEKSLEIRLRLAEETKTVESRRDLAVSYGKLGEVAQAEGRLTDARGYYEKFLEIAVALVEETKTIESLHDLAASYDRLGSIAQAERRLTDAREYYEKSIKIAVVLAEGLKTVQLCRDLSVSYDRLGNIAQLEGQLADARKYYEKSLVIRRKIAEETKTAESRRNLSISYGRLGNIAQEEGRLTDARKYYERSFEIDAALAEETKTVESRRNLSVCYEKLGNIAQLEGRLADAREYYEKSLGVRQKLAEETKTVQSYDDLAASYSVLGVTDYPSINRDYLLKALEILELLIKACPAVISYKKKYDLINKLLESSKEKDNKTVNKKTGIYSKIAMFLIGLLVSALLIFAIYSLFFHAGRMTSVGSVSPADAAEYEANIFNAEVGLKTRSVYDDNAIMIGYTDIEETIS